MGRLDLPDPIRDEDIFPPADDEEEDEDAESA